MTSIPRCPNKLKTDEDWYNAKDFLQIDGTLREITVEITLAEYRDLISPIQRQDDRILELNKELNEAIEKLSDAAVKLSAAMDELEALKGAD